MITSDDFVEEARRWIGRPFLHQGRTWDGVDCIGLAVVVCKNCGLISPDFDTGIYGRMPANDMLQARISQHCTPLEVARAGSLVVIRWSKEASHVALCLGETIIHAHERMGKVIEHGYRGRWIRMTASVWALPGLTYV